MFIVTGSNSSGDGGGDDDDDDDDNNNNNNRSLDLFQLHIFNCLTLASFVYTDGAPLAFSFSGVHYKYSYCLF
jgi:hypothetical protein